MADRRDTGRDFKMAEMRYSSRSESRCEETLLSVRFGRVERRSRLRDAAGNCSGTL